METTQQRTWTPSFVSISLTQLTVFAVFYALVAALPLYVVSELGGSATQAGLVITVMVFAQVLVRLFAEPILGILGRKRGLVLAVLLFALNVFPYAWADGLGWLYVIRFFHGFWFGIITTATGAIAANVVPAERRGEGIGYFAMATNVAVVIGPFVSLVLLQRISFGSLFTILGFAGFAAVVAVLRVRVPQEQPAVRVGEKGRRIEDFIEPRAIPVSAVMGLATLAYAGITAFVPVYAGQLGLSRTAAFFFLVYAAAMLVTRPYFGRRYDSRGPSSVVVPGLILFGAGFVALGLINGPVLLMVAAVLIGLGFGAVHPSMQTMAVQSTTRDRSGHAPATFFTFFDSGIAVGSLVLGIVVDAFGFRVLYLASAVLVFALIGLFALVSPRRE